MGENKNITEQPQELEAAQEIFEKQVSVSTEIIKMRAAKIEFMRIQPLLRKYVKLLMIVTIFTIMFSIFKKIFSLIQR